MRVNDHSVVILAEFEEKKNNVAFIRESADYFTIFSQID